MAVSKMIRQKKEYRCTVCDAKALKFSGYCPGCNKAGTMREHILIPVKAKPKATLSQKGLARRAKNSERGIASRMQAVDGADPVYRNVTSSTGRVGHISGMQIDAISKNYVIENKNRTLPMWMNKAWIQILQRARDFDKNPLLHIEPSNIAREYPVNGVKYKTDTMAIIPQSRHEDLIITERQVQQAREVIQSGDSNVVKVRKIMDILS
jgi:hypothetical protein